MADQLQIGALADFAYDANGLNDVAARSGRKLQDIRRGLEDNETVLAVLVRQGRELARERGKLLIALHRGAPYSTLKDLELRLRAIRDARLPKELRRLHPAQAQLANEQLREQFGEDGIP